jgi:hypothetical protein
LKRVIKITTATICDPMGKDDERRQALHSEDLLQLLVARVLKV